MNRNVDWYSPVWLRLGGILFLALTPAVAQECPFPGFLDNGAELRHHHTSHGDAFNAVAVNTATGAIIGAGMIRLPVYRGRYDALVAAYDANGVPLWDHRIFGSLIYGVDVNPTTGTVAVGGFVTTTFPGQQYAGGDSDAFVALYDATGTQLWVDQFGTSAGDVVKGVAVNPITGTIAVGGRTYGTLQGQNSSGGGDAWAGLYAANGTQLWLHQFGTSAEDVVNGVGVNPVTGTIAVGGATGSALPGQQHNGGTDAFVAIYTEDGTQISMEQFGTSGVDDVTCLSVNPADGTIAVGGRTTGLAGPIDAFVALYDADGTGALTRRWLSKFTSTGSARGTEVHGIAANAATGTIVVGGYTDCSTFEGQPCGGGIVGFVALYDSGGTQLWLEVFGNPAAGSLIDYAQVSDVGVNPSTGAIAVSGHTNGVFLGTQPTGGYNDAFVAATPPCYTLAPVTPEPTAEPTAAPSTGAPTTAPITSTPSGVPTTSTPSGVPTTATPTVSPTESPTALVAAATADGDGGSGTWLVPTVVAILLLIALVVALVLLNKQKNKPKGLTAAMQADLASSTSGAATTVRMAYNPLYTSPDDTNEISYYSADGARPQGMVTNPTYASTTVPV